MNQTAPHKDLVVLVADKSMEAAVRSALCRPQALRIRNITFDVYRHPQKDTGCRVRSAQFLSAFTRIYEHAIVLFDCEGSGTKASAQDTETIVERELPKAGWSNRAAAVVIEPELEAWIWSDSPVVDRILGWREKKPALPLRHWLEQKGFLAAGRVKPLRPKEALEAVLLEMKRPRTSSLYDDMAREVGLDRCADRAFLKFKKTLQSWFPP